MVKVYVAGGSTERLTVVRPYMDRLREHGCEITHDWTTDRGYEAAPTKGDRMASAGLDLNGVRRAEVVWFIAPEEKSEGAGVELGYAIALGKRIVISGARDFGVVFSELAYARFVEHERAYRFVVNGAPLGS